MFVYLLIVYYPYCMKVGDEKTTQSYYASFLLVFVIWQVVEFETILLCERPLFDEVAIEYGSGGESHLLV